MKNQKNTFTPPLICYGKGSGGLVPEGTKTMITCKPTATLWWRRYGFMALMLMTAFINWNNVKAQPIYYPNGDAMPTTSGTGAMTWNLTNSSSSTAIYFCGWKDGVIWCDQTIDFNFPFEINFMASFDNVLDPVYGADGMCVVFGPNVLPGISAGGGGGGDLGYYLQPGSSTLYPPYVNSFAVEYDIYYNPDGNGDYGYIWFDHFNGNHDHTAITRDQDYNAFVTTTSHPVLLNGAIGIRDGLFHKCTIKWDPGDGTTEHPHVLKVYYDCNLKITSNFDYRTIFGSTYSPNIHWGISASTGDKCSNQRVHFVNLITPINLCVGNASTLYGYATSGVWTSSNTAIATVDASTGLVTGLTLGTVDITFDDGTTCPDIYPVTVTNSVSPIVGVPYVCVGNTLILTDATSGGTWSSSDDAIATISTSGIVTGVATGTVNIDYTAACGIATVVLTVDALPAIIGIPIICVGSTAIFTDGTSGGTWSSTNPFVASVDVSGIVTGITTGISTIDYTMSNSCFTTLDIFVETIIILGNAPFCVGNTINLTISGPTGGTWSSSNTTIATVSSTGTVTGVGSGTCDITYTGDCTATITVTVNPQPGPITGTTIICEGEIAVFTDGTSGGTWSSSNTAIASVDVSGIVTGVSAGICTISYTLSGGCFATYDVDILSNEITGNAPMCVGYIINLTAVGSTGGIWGSSNTLIATVSSTGTVTGVGSGTCIISYTGVCPRSVIVTVNPLPEPITGDMSICAGMTTTVYDATPGGTWSSSGGITIIPAAADGTGIVTGTTGGTATVTYTLPTGCYVTATIDVTAQPVVSCPDIIVCCTESTGIQFNTTVDGLLNPTTDYSYSWTPALGLSDYTIPNPTALCSLLTTTTTYALTVTNHLTGCMTTITTTAVIVPSGSTCTPCGKTPTACGGTPFAPLGGGTGTISADVPPGNYYIGNDVTIVGNITFKNAVIMIAPTVHIYVRFDASLTIAGSHLYSCEKEMWQGIVLENTAIETGTLVLQADGKGVSTLIEDAIIGVNVQHPTTPNSYHPWFLASYNTIFNRCNIDISIDNYSPATSTIVGDAYNYEFHIENTVFTCRDFSSYMDKSGCINPFRWPNTVGDPTALKWVGMMTNEYLLNNTIVNYPYLACNNAGMVGPVTIGIALKRIGTLTAPDYAGIKVGAPPSFVGGYSDNYEMNLFDTLYYGIKAINANLTLENNCFAHANHGNVFSTSPDVLAGVGVYAVMQDGNQYSLSLIPLIYGIKFHPDIAVNSFYNCKFGVYCKNYYHIIGNNSQMVTSNTVGTGMLNPYLFGYDITTCAYDNISLVSNKITNVPNGISIISNYAPGYYYGGMYHMPAQYAGNIDVDSNTIQTSFSWGSIAGRYVNYGVSIQNMINRPTGYSGILVTAAGSVNTMYNTINNVRRGIYVSNYWMQPSFTLNNDITLFHEPASIFTYGINHSSCNKVTVNNNTVTGTDANEMTDSVKAYYMANNIQLQVGCNAATDVGRGYEFFHNNIGTFWHDNDMTNNNKGYVLNHSYIGPQGNPMSAILDHWQVPTAWNWTTNVQTYVIGTPFAPSSPIYVVTSSATDYPTFNLNLVNGYSLSGARNSAIPSYNELCKKTNVMGGLGKETGSGLEDVVRKFIPYQEDSAVRTWIGQYGAWQYINNDTEQLINSVIVDSFYSLALQSRYAYLTNIENALVSGDTATANWYIANPKLPLASNGQYIDTTTNVIVADDSTGDNIVANYQAFYNLYLNYLNENLSSIDSAAIIAMAGLCPGVNGMVVYQARTLYSAVFGVLGVWNDDGCYPVDTNGNRYGNRKSNNVTNDVKQQYQLFPNPNDGNFSLMQLMPDSEPISLRVWNEIGSCIYKDLKSCSQSIITIDLGKCTPGIYFVNIIDSKGKIYTIKFIAK